MPGILTRHPRRRQPRRVRRHKNKPVRVPLPLGGFPETLMVKLRYVETFTLNPGVATYAQNIFVANSLYDPNNTGVGHQPSNYDKLATIYDRYTVVGSNIKVYPVHIDETVDTPGTLIVHLSEGGSDLATAFAAGGIDNVLEQPRLTRSLRNFTSHASWAPDVPLDKNFSAKKFFGKKADLSAEPYSADIGANPAEMAFYEVMYATSDGSNDPSSQVFRAEITYIAVMSEPKLTDAS